RCNKVVARSATSGEGWARNRTYFHGPSRSLRRMPGRRACLPFLRGAAALPAAKHHARRAGGADRSGERRLPSTPRDGQGGRRRYRDQPLVGQPECPALHRERLASGEKGPEGLPEEPARLDGAVLRRKPGLV